QLMRVFGRVLGLGWSQVNDNVFTGSPAPTYLQQMHWPIMHPMDIICGLYTYQCLPQPFTLREDDVAAMWMLYADASSSYVNANSIAVTGSLAFPGGIPMSGVNVTVRRYQLWGAYGTDAYQDIASVSGYNISENRGNPVTGPSSDTLGINGSTTAATFANFNMGALTLTTGTYLTFSSEAVNPLYVGEYAVGPYRMGSPSLSGAALSKSTGRYVAGGSMYTSTVATDAASDCTTGQDGTENVPAPLSADGSWSGRLCGVGHTSWMKFAVKAGHTATVEVTATDESGSASLRKAMPLIGVWHAADAMGSQPGIAATATAFNSPRVGMTQLRVSFATTESIRLAVTDARGDGRPDYTYRARVLYADTVLPTRVAASGGAIVITGMGFGPGSTVTIGGVVARVTSVNATEIDAIAPALSSGAKDVVVTDLTTGGTTTVSGALVYGGSASDVLTWAAQPMATVAVGAPATIGLRVTDVSGKPVPNGVVTLAATTGSVLFGACSLAQCTLSTDATGVLQTTVTATIAGTITLKATSAGGATVQLSYTATTVALGVTLLRPTEYVAAGADAAFTPAVLVMANGTVAAGTAVTWTSSSMRVGLSPAQSVSDVSGIASVATVGSLRDNETATVQACAWASVCAVQSLIGVSAADLRVSAVSGDAQSVGIGDSLGNVVLRVVDAVGHPVAGASVALYQVVTGWQPSCTTGRCAAAPIYGKATSTAMSNDDGLVTVLPLQYANTAAVTKITASVGTQGAITVTLTKTP
ncbi:MAG TPA: IPT/TIG domain-containing protein, partial [Terriglobus sp.]